MRNPVYTNAFKKDVKLAKKRSLDMAALRFVMTEIACEKSLAAKYRNHKLTGNWKEHWECHISPDWLLVYKLQGDDVIFERTGSHSDLF
ncbi:MAG TPA: type II toxin-antitoxin system YafQ family toxin [Rhodoferax sp.]